MYLATLGKEQPAKRVYLVSRRDEKTERLSHGSGGDTGTRTLDPLLAKQVL